MMAARIYIPSAGRHGQSLMTLRSLSEAALKRSILVVPCAQISQYEKNQDVINSKVLVVGTRVDGISKTRQWIQGQAWPAVVYIMLDDDMYFYTRRDMSSPKLERCTFAEVNRMLTKMEKVATRYGYFACGLSARQGNNHESESLKLNTRMMNAYAINSRALRNEKVRFDKIPVMEDFWVTLNMLTRGWKNGVLFDFCWNQSGSNLPGGCSEYRTEKVQAYSARQLREAFPEFVKITTKKGWKNMKERTDVIVQWKKAHDFGVLHSRQRR